MTSQLPARAPRAVIDVHPLRDGTWEGTCECGQRDAFARQDQAWAWVLDHPCLPVQRS